MWKATRLQKGILICLIVICSTFLIFLSINTVQAAAQEKTIIKSITGWACEGYVCIEPALSCILAGLAENWECTNYCQAQPSGIWSCLGTSQCGCVGQLN
jgi:hypothetical protein